METKTKSFVAQYKSVYEPSGWSDDGGGYIYLDEAREHAKMLRNVNPNVRVIEREINEREVA